jgi:gamma-glutamylcyclotransferase (GGCT)/AIG2-like uncharacterized protein YtfP
MSLEMPESGAGRELVFVYGTLRRRGSNAFRMKGARFVGQGYVAGKLYTVSWYPGLVLERTGSIVTGEVFRVGPEQLHALDEFEGLAAGEMEGSEYQRLKVECVIESATMDDTVLVWAYEWKGRVDEERRIPSGDWIEHTAGKIRPVFTLLAAGMAVCSVLAQFSFFLGWVARSGGMRWVFPLALGSAGIGPLIVLGAALIAGRRGERLVALRWHCIGLSVSMLLVAAVLVAAAFSR